ncbi:MAG: hypothetical protein A2270_00925 [Elusimicrobia bacterium RIFOXYA12_FULL_51_18]|nr:MAG: hypothetical protein A2270_00925 [Elusimicrobia bacterium RIFOXYA12_FULL_51_18]OGS29057.1 MAG: hypothetical protein A2218_08940 [Elusimicrobia bacterium RIFOXYA2_FULL_53_38]
MSAYNNKLEAQYSKNVPLRHRKSFGQFFTPYNIAVFMSEWILGSRKKELRVLDPAAGLGVFPRAINAVKKAKKIQMSLWEIDSRICSGLVSAVREFSIPIAINNSDFLSAPWREKFDGIIANPPYYKHHFIANKDVWHQAMCVNSFFSFSKQTNIYCWFLVKAIGLLSDKGRFAFIIPSEFLNSNYGEKIKEFLLSSGTLRHMIVVDFKESLFDNALTTSVIVLGEKSSSKNKEVCFYTVTDVACLKNLNKFLKITPRKSLPFSKLDPKIKWRNYFNGNAKIESDGFESFARLGRFSRGIATGSNEYFVLSRDEAIRHHMPLQALVPCIYRASYVKDIAFTDDDFELLKRDGKKVYLFDGKGSDSEFCAEYIQFGEKLGVNDKFLTKNRKPWYALEKRAVSKIWVSVFGRNGLKFIWNTSCCKNLTCFHSFYPTEYGAGYLDILFIYLNSSLAKNIFDLEKREYGDGLEKFEPNDINKSKAIRFSLLSDIDVKRLAQLQRALLKSSRCGHAAIISEADSIFNRYARLPSVI